MYHIVEIYFPEFRGSLSYGKCFAKFIATKEYELDEKVHVTGTDGKIYVGYVVCNMYTDELPQRLAKTTL